MGYDTFNVGPEAEFFLFQTDEEGKPTTRTNDEAGYFDLGASLDRPLGPFSSKNTFFPSRNRDMLVCIPEPLMPKMGLGMKVAWSPFF